MNKKYIDILEKVKQKKHVKLAFLIHDLDSLRKLFLNVQDDFEYMDLATTPEENPAVKRFQEVAKELDVVIPVSFFERAGNAAFNSIAIIDADGTVLGKYRKTHIPDGMPYAEKFFFTPGDTGFKVWKTITIFSL